LIDTCVFPLPALKAFILAQQAGHVELLWSPWIIAETHRLLTSRWIEKHLKSGGTWDSPAKRRLSHAAHTWLRLVAPAFEVIEDRPPLEAAWTTPLPDEYDWPVWTAAVRGRAQFLVTANLRDGPPPDASGTRYWQGITYVHPDEFQILLNIWSDIMETHDERPIWSIAEYWESRQRQTGTDQTPISPQIERFLAELEDRAHGHGETGTLG
jgi:hypothetical protein